MPSLFKISRACAMTSAGMIVRSPAPTFATKWPRFVVPIRTAEQHHDQMTRIDGYRLALGHDFWFAIGGENQAVPRSGCAASFHSVNAIFSEKFVRAPEHIIGSMPTAIERDLAFLLR